jgi:hypothetical protein
VVIDIVLPAMLGLVLIRKTGVEAYNIEGQLHSVELGRSASTS